MGQKESRNFVRNSSHVVKCPTGNYAYQSLAYLFKVVGNTLNLSASTTWLFAWTMVLKQLICTSGSSHNPWKTLCLIFENECLNRLTICLGTSSKSTKLVHGGVRYLRKAIMELDYEQYKLVKEALHERRIFLQTAPYLSAMLPIMLPVYKWVRKMCCACISEYSSPIFFYLPSRNCD